MNRVIVLAGGSILVAVVVLILKSLAYLMTGSVALLSDAIESIVNVATAIAAFIAIRLSNTFGPRSSVCAFRSTASAVRLGNCKGQAFQRLLLTRC
jgi:hypothetical protein